LFNGIYVFKTYEKLFADSDVQVTKKKKTSAKKDSDDSLSDFKPKKEDKV